METPEQQNTLKHRAIVTFNLSLIDLILSPQGWNISYCIL